MDGILVVVFRVPLLFLVVGLTELWLLVTVEGRIGLGWTVAVIVVTAIVGGWLVRLQGAWTLARIVDRFRAGGFPGRELAHGGLLVVAGALLLTPGFLTDAVGAILLFPPAREAIRVRLERWARSRFVVR